MSPQRAALCVTVSSLQVPSAFSLWLCYIHSVHILWYNSTLVSFFILGFQQASFEDVRCKCVCPRILVKNGTGPVFIKMVEPNLWWVALANLVALRFGIGSDFFKLWIHVCSAAAVTANIWNIKNMKVWTLIPFFLVVRQQQAMMALSFHTAPWSSKKKWSSPTVQSVHILCFVFAYNAAIEALLLCCSHSASNHTLESHFLIALILQSSLSG